MFVLYRLVPRADGKTDKIPTCPRTGVNIDAQDSANWLLPAEACAWVEQRRSEGYSVGVGLVLHDGCGLWCIDLDCARIGDGWKPYVSNFIARFPGAYVETSVSFSGIHIIGSASALPQHCTRNKEYGAELYTRARFIAVTGAGAYGDPLTDLTAEFTAFAAQFFPPHGDVDHGAEWTDKPVPQWRGPIDDEQLIARALRSTSAGSVFGGRASFADLWRANPDALARSFPPQSSHQTYDGSAADQALANHLSFWTGNDCERMLRIMRMSGLVRPKWDRLDYMRGTILRACGDQKEWYAERGEESAESSIVAALPGVPAPPAVPAPPTAPPESSLRPGEKPPVGFVVLLHHQLQVFDGLCYVRDVQKIQLLDGTSVNQAQFDVVLGGREYVINSEGTRPTRSAWEAFTKNQLHDFPQVHTQCFDPSLPTGAIRMRDGMRQINCYQPAIIRRVSGDPEPFLTFLRKLIPDPRDNLILLSYMAACIQNIGVKFMWWPFIQGVKGNGKTTIGRIMEYNASQRYTHWAKSAELSEKFNAVFTDKLLTIIDEAKTTEKAETEEVIKIMVTSKRQEVRPMYAEKMMKDVCYNGVIFSNYQNGVRIDKDERRFSPFYCAQQAKSDLARDGLTAEYFIHLNRWLDADGFAIIYNYLSSFAVPDEFNPAASCVVAPITTSTEQALLSSLGGIEQEVLSAIEQRREGFRGGWISSTAVDRLLSQIGKDKAIPRVARHELIVGLGYDPHPSLPKDGLCEATFSDGTMPRLYVRKGHAWAVTHLSADQVKQGFLDAQK